MKKKIVNWSVSRTVDESTTKNTYANESMAFHHFVTMATTSENNNEGLKITEIIWNAFPPFRSQADHGLNLQQKLRWNGFKFWGRDANDEVSAESLLLLIRPRHIVYWAILIIILLKFYHIMLYRCVLVHLYNCLVACMEAIFLNLSNFIIIMIMIL